MTDDQCLNILKNPSKNDFFILDIDSTLVTTHQRNQAILNEWVKLNAKEFHIDCQQLKTAQCQFGDYGLRDALNRIQFKEVDILAKKSLDDFWHTHFFSNTYLHHDAATRGAVDWTQTLEEMGVDFVYLTARHKETMWEGTLQSMDKIGFPISEDTLFLKEDLTLTDEQYKTVLVGEIAEKNSSKKIWFIDNEPVVLHRILQDHPKINLVFFNSTHSGKMDPPPKVTTIQNFTFSANS